MSKRSLRKIRHITNPVMPKKESTHICRNCGEKGTHFAPPSFGEEGFFICQTINTP